METKGFFQLEIIIDVLVSSFWFFWIPILWVYGQYKYFYYNSAGIDLRRQNVSDVCIRQILAIRVYLRAVSDKLDNIKIYI